MGMDIARYWKIIVDTLQDGLMVVDPRGKILAANPAAEKLTGYTAEELVGKIMSDFELHGLSDKGPRIGPELVQFVFKRWCPG